MSRRQKLGHALAAFLYLLFAVNFTAGWARYLMGDDVALPWPLYPLGAALWFWSAMDHHHSAYTKEGNRDE